MSVLLRYASLRRLQVVLGLALMGLVFAPSASVAALAPGCSQSGQTVTCTYTSASNPFTVPAGVSSIHVVAVGGTGGLNPAGTDAGHGAVVSGDLALPAGGTVYAVVGGNGVVGAPGAGGGGQGGTAFPCSFVSPPPECASGLDTGGGGGGASDVRTSQTDLSSRLLVAAGGGGAGGPFPPASSGPSGGEGGSGQGSGADGAGGGGGGRAGGAGGAGGAVPSPCQPHMACLSGTAGSEGALGVGGRGGIGGAFGGCLCSILFGTGGGAGGGGWFGGGGGGGGGTGSGGGGGGGSNLVPSGGSQSIDTTGVPMVQISYKLLPTSKAQCKNGGWRNYGAKFKTQGQCVAFVVKQAVQKCVAERARIGLVAFRSKYGLGRYHVLALLRCINQASR